nr:peptidoglycan recognition protein-S2 [Glyphodes pyloalis]
MDLVETDHNSESVSYGFPFVSRSEWQAKEPVERNPLPTPVSYVVIHHSYIHADAKTTDECKQAMRAMQEFHIIDRCFTDIGYNFLVGCDGSAYEGCGWKIKGAHCLYFNPHSIGICLIGDWRHEVPPDHQLKTTKALIAAGVELGYIKPDYKIVGHRQVRLDTECPGDALLNEIQDWDHYSSYPRTAKDLLDLEEVPESTKAVMRRNPAFNGNVA